MPHFVTGSDNLLLTGITTGGVLLTAIMTYDKSLRVSNLHEVVWMLLRCDPFAEVSIVNGVKISATHAKQRVHVS